MGQIEFYVQDSRMKNAVQNSWLTMLTLLFTTRSFTTRAFAPSSSLIGARNEIKCMESGSRIFVRQMSLKGQSSGDASSREEKSSGNIKTDYSLKEQYSNKNNIDDQVFSAMSKDGSVKVTACTARNLVNDLMIMHTMTAVPADALGRTIVCALLMSNGIQEEQVVQLTLNCELE